MIYSLAGGAALAGAAFQYENWNGPRELAGARAQLFTRTGTLEPMALLPEEVPENDNFFAIPLIKSWLVKRQCYQVAKPLTGEGILIWK